MRNRTDSGVADDPGEAEEEHDAPNVEQAPDQDTLDPSELESHRFRFLGAAIGLEKKTTTTTTKTKKKHKKQKQTKIMENAAHNERKLPTSSGQLPIHATASARSRALFPF